MPLPQFAAVGESIEDVVVQYLRTAEPSRRSLSFESALKVYFSRLDEASRKHILPDWVRLSEIYERAGPTNSKKRKRKPSGNDRESFTENEKLRELQQQALVFLNQRERERARAEGRKMKPVDPETMEKRIAALRSGLQWHDDHKIGEMWSSKDQAEPPQTATPVQRLTILHNGVSSSADFDAFKLRILKLLWLHECKQARIKISKGESKKMEEKTGMCFGKAESVAKTARGWLMLIDAWGIGGLFMPAPGQCSLFERDFTKEQIEDLWVFCENYMSDIKVKVENMRKTALRLFVEAVDKYGGDAETLETGGSHLATAYRTNGSLFEHNPSVEASNRSGDTCPSLEACPENSAFDTQGHIRSTQFRADSPRTLPSGLQVLTDAIDQVESSGPESAPDVGQDQSTQDSQAQHQLRAWNEGLVAEQVPGLPPTQAGSASGATYGQDIRSPWQMHTNGRSPATSSAPAGAHVPFAAAGQVQTHEPGSTSGNSQHGLAVGTQARGQSLPGAWNEGVIAEQPLQPTLCHGPRSSNKPTSNVPSRAGASIAALGATATAVTSPWQSDEQIAQPSLPPLNSYVGLGLIGAHNVGLPNADVFTQTVHENAFTPVQIRQQIAHGYDTHIQWPPYNEQTLHPEPDHADANTATQSVPSECRPTKDYCQLQQNRAHDDPTTTDLGATYQRDGEDHLSDDWDKMVNVLYSDLGYSTI